MSDADALTELDSAVRAYFRRTDPDLVVTSWLFSYESMRANSDAPEGISYNHGYRVSPDATPAASRGLASLAGRNLDIDIFGEDQ